MVSTPPSDTFFAAYGRPDSSGLNQNLIASKVTTHIWKLILEGAAEESHWGQ